MRELKKRLLSGVLAGPVVLALIYFLPAMPFFFLMVLVAVLAVIEITAMAHTSARYLVVILSVLAVIPLYAGLLPAYLFWLLLSPAVFLAYCMVRPPRCEGPVTTALGRDLAVMLLSQTLILLPLFSMYKLKQLGNLLPLVLLLTIWASDTGAYFLGSTVGRRRLAPLISPNKTVEGLAGAVLGGMVVMALFSRPMGIGVAASVGVGALLGLLGQLGDIAESVGKRVFGVKDSSGLIPGHGGILDRIDSFLFTTPFVYHYLAGFAG